MQTSVGPELGQKMPQTITSIDRWQFFLSHLKFSLFLLYLFTGEDFGAECQTPRHFTPAAAAAGLKHQPLRPAYAPVSPVGPPASRWQNHRYWAASGFSVLTQNSFFCVTLEIENHVWLQYVQTLKINGVFVNWIQCMWTIGLCFVWPLPGKMF